MVNEAIFCNEAFTILGPMMGNDKVPKVVQTYWMDENREKRVHKIEYGQQATMFVRTQNVDAGETIKVNVTERDNKKIDGSRSVITFSGTVNDDGTATLELLTQLENKS